MPPSSRSGPGFAKMVPKTQKNLKSLSLRMRNEENTTLSLMFYTVNCTNSKYIRYTFTHLELQVNSREEREYALESILNRRPVCRSNWNLKKSTYIGPDIKGSCFSLHESLNLCFTSVMFCLLQVHLHQSSKITSH